MLLFILTTAGIWFPINHICSSADFIGSAKWLLKYVHKGFHWVDILVMKQFIHE